MICPTCREVMIVVEQERIELDHCPNCLGVWFDAGELELVLEGMGLKSSDLFPAPIDELPEAETDERKRRCPICNQKMKKLYIGKEPEVLIDACIRGHGLWFDGGEVHQIIEQCAKKPGSEAGSGERLLSFLGNTFKAEG
jgi:hypothetical protein